MKHHVHLLWQESKDDLVFKGHATDANSTRWSEKKRKDEVRNPSFGSYFGRKPQAGPGQGKREAGTQTWVQCGCGGRIRENMAVPTWSSTWGSENFPGDSAVPPFLDPKWTSWKCTNLLRRWRGPSPWGAPHYLARTCCLKKKKKKGTSYTTKWLERLVS